MRTLLLTLMVVATALPIAACGAQVAQARAYCLSLRFQRGSEPFDLYHLSLSTLASGVNGELTPASGTYSHGSGILLGDTLGIDEPIPGTMFVNVPSGGDQNENGFPDFFEVSQGVSGVTSGQFTTPVANGTVTATWNRAAGSKDGTCVLELKTNPFQSLGKFTHSFELIEYQGTCSYTPGSNTVPARLELTQTGNPTRQLNGPIRLSKVAANPANQLRLQAGALTNDATQELSFFADDYSRDLVTRSNYYGALEFQDGDLDTAAEDYYLWMLSLDDVNDGDHDGIPDFSDDPQASGRAPLLALSLGESNLVLTISGELGRVHKVLEADSIVSTNWQAIASVTLTNDPQVVTLPISGGPKFWRVLVP